jgi:transposase
MHSTREILNAVFCIVRGDCALGCCRTSSLRHEDRLPPLPFLAHRDGTWERMHAALLKRVRIKRNPQPSAAIMDRASGSRASAWEAINAGTMAPRR